MASIGDNATLKRLLFEAHTFVLSQFRGQISHPEAASRKVQVEREARMEALKSRLSGALIQRKLEPADLLDRAAQMWEAPQLKCFSPEKCMSREWEIMHG